MKEAYIHRIYEGFKRIYTVYICVYTSYILLVVADIKQKLGTTELFPGRDITALMLVKNPNSRIYNIYTRDLQEESQ